MIRLPGWLTSYGKHSSSKPLTDVRQHANRVRRVSMIDTVHEISIYLHRFHNLDLFQQGWYQIKITLRREDDENTSLGTPARVVQYEASDLASDVVWRINDEENSFSTQPFWIKYARQNALLSIMVTFNLSSDTYEAIELALTTVPSIRRGKHQIDKASSSSAVIIKFELMCAPISEKTSHLQAILDSCSVAVHEFRLPPKALMGLHSYCPVHFDAFHSVLIDSSVHVTHLKSTAPPSKVPSAYCALEGVPGKRSSALNQTLELVESVDENDIKLLKGLLIARDILLEELETLSKATDLVTDMAHIVSKIQGMEFPSFMQAGLGAADIPGPGKPNGVEKSNGTEKFGSDISLWSLSRDDFMKSLHSLGNQGLYLWSFFLQLHRVNSMRILEFLRDVWAKDRIAEWSIWMIYTKAEMPHHFISSGAKESPNSVPMRASSMQKLIDDPAQIAVMRAELHRRSIAQMRINNRSVQDMHIFGDPLRIPVVIVEQVVNSPQCTTSDKIYFDLLKDPLLVSGAVTKQNDTIQLQKGRVLKIVVFVHGFQGNHLDLRLVRNQWLLVDPRIEFLMSEANEGKTSGDFREMGLRLAQEVVSFFKKQLDRVPILGFIREIKLSFVGHSIGNVIIRAALSEPIMQPFLRYLYTYVSISGPHLGYLYSSNSLFNSGLWLLKKLKNTPCIHQLTFTDDPDLRNTFLYKLCKQNTLENFRHIILLSSPQDGYIPYHSARIEPCPASSVDNSKKGRVFLEMLNNCLDQIRAPSSDNRIFMRCDVNFDTSAYGKNMNSFIGRAAHIDFLESDIYTMFIMWSFRDLFS